MFGSRRPRGSVYGPGHKRDIWLGLVTGEHHCCSDGAVAQWFGAWFIFLGCLHVIGSIPGSGGCAGGQGLRRWDSFVARGRTFALL